MPTIPRLIRKKKPETANLIKQRSIAVYNNERWKALRKAKLMANPVCERCGEALATCVHHVIEFAGANDETLRNNLAFDIDNLQSLCEKCHREIHGNWGCNKYKNE